MRIGELAGQVGVGPDTIRDYEREGLLPQPPRAGNGYREYGAEDVDHLRLVTDLRRLDLPLSAAARLATWCHSGHCTGRPSSCPATWPSVDARSRTASPASSSSTPAWPVSSITRARDRGLAPT